VGELLAIAQRKSRKTTSVATEKKPEGPPAASDEAQKAFDERPKAPELPSKAKAPKHEQRRTGRNAIPEHIEAEKHALRPPSCEHCGSSELEVVDTVTEGRVHWFPSRESPRRQRASTSSCGEARNVPMSALSAPHNTRIAARALRSFEGHLRLAGLVHPSKVCAALAARPRPP